MQPDKELWLRVSEDDQQAYAQLYRVLFRRLYNYGRKFSEEETLIEDAAQETLSDVWFKRNNLPSIVHPTTYYFTVFRNALLAKLKISQRYSKENAEEDDLEFAADHFIIIKETDSITREKIVKAIGRLTSRQREAIFLRFYEGLSYEDVSQMLNITVKATYKIMARALEELRQVLKVSGSFLLFLLSYTATK